MHAFWLVLTYDLLEDWRVDDESARFKFGSCVILWTNHNSLLSIATNQKFGFIKRVDKGWITTVKGLENHIFVFISPTNAAPQFL